MKAINKHLLRALVSFSFTLCAFYSLSQDGSLDLTFDTDGKVTFPWGPGDEYSASITTQSNGKIVAVGFYYNGAGSEFAVARFNPDGSFDNTFDGDGRVTTILGFQSNRATSVLMQPDGKIVVSGYYFTGGSFDFGMARYNSNGSLDNSFNGDGIVQTGFVSAENDYAEEVLIQPDGKLILIGRSYNGSNEDIGICRYDVNGNLDLTFSGDGKQTNSVGTSIDAAYTGALQSDGKIIVAGNFFNNATTRYDFLIMRYNANGTLDNTFDGDGIAMTDMAGLRNDGVFSVAIQNDGKIVAVGYVDNGTNYDIGIARYNTNGSLDNTFSGDGKLTTDILSGNNAANSVVIQPDGKILIGGYATIGGARVFAAARYLTDGTLDNSFGAGGIQTTAIGTSFDEALGITLQSDGKILMAGQTYNGFNNDFAIIRYNNTICSVPSMPTSISGTTTICSGTSNTYSITPVAGATSYTWTLPGGWSGTSTSNSITAIPGSNSGNVTVTANNTCGSSTAQTVSISVNSAPTTPGTVSGNTSVCSGTSQSYAVTNDPAATSYTWTLPSGWSGTSTTNSITATAGATGGTISVIANNGCGSSSAQTLMISVNSVLATPGTISGTTTVCSGTSQTYSVTNDPTATSYTWTLPGGWSGTSTSNSITATAGASGGTISVIANNGCGSSSAQTLAVNVNSAPTTPGTVSGNTSVCSGTSQSYAVTNDPAATSYTWTLPSGWSGTSTTNSITATAGASGGTISVIANNGCGSSAVQTLTVSVNSAPGTPSVISGNTSVCAGSTQLYSILNDPNASSYTWAIPAAWGPLTTTNTITLNPGPASGVISVMANNACGSSLSQSLSVNVSTTPLLTTPISGSNSVCVGSSQTYLVPADPNISSYTWTLPSGWSGSSTGNSITVIPGANGGTISVVANNVCGASPAQNMSVNVNAAPVTPSIITGNTTVCFGSVETYAVANDPGVQSYAWSFPAGWSGSSSGSSISLTAGASGGTISVIASNSCGSSAAQSINVNSANVPATPSLISGSASICNGSTEIYSVINDPGATSYTWTIPAGWGSPSTTNSVTLNPGPPNGVISVSANNTCGTSAVQSLTINVSDTPATPGPISGNTNICSGTTQTYSVPSDPVATSYTWVLPAGWTGNSSTNSISAIPGTGGGTMWVYASNACGTSSGSMLLISVSNAPDTPSAISGDNPVCAGSVLTYSVTNDPNTSSYTWSLPPGWTGGSLSNSIQVTAGSVGGTLSVVASNACGSSSDETLEIVVNPLPTVTYVQSPSEICLQAGSVSLSPANPVGGVYSGTGVVSTSFDPMLAGVGTFAITYTYSDGNGCENSASQNITVEDCAAISSYELAGLNLFPNPFEDYFEIHFPSTEAHSIELYNASGQLLQTVQTNGAILYMSTAHLSAGMYMVSVDQTQRIKIVKHE